MTGAPGAPGAPGGPGTLGDSLFLVGSAKQQYEIAFIFCERL